MSILKTRLRTLKEKYWPLIKSLQTGLLILTGLAGFMSARCPMDSWQMMLALIASLFFSISGSTILNMWYDRDIDARMKRTCTRPLPSGKVSPRNALVLGLIISGIGVGIALLMNLWFGVVIFAGLFFDVVVYTIWLKRRTHWSIIWGGISGGMPILAGRVLGLGHFDWIGIALALAILFWIPTHILTFNIRRSEDYASAGIPTFPARFGKKATRKIIAFSSIIAALAMGVAAYGIGMTIGYLRIMIVLSSGLLLLAVSGMIHSNERINFGLFKYASLYMLSSMLLVMAEGI